jgi:hypothetical protein
VVHPLPPKPSEPDRMRLGRDPGLRQGPREVAKGCRRLATSTLRKRSIACVEDDIPTGPHDGFFVLALQKSCFLEIEVARPSAIAWPTMT